MRGVQRVGMVLLLGMTLFSGRSLLVRAMRPAHESAHASRHLADASQEERSQAAPAISPKVALALADRLAEQVAGAPSTLAPELTAASRACVHVAESAAQHRLDPSTARAAIARAHAALARRDLARAEQAWHERDLPAAGLALDGARHELGLAATWSVSDTAPVAPEEDERALVTRLRAADAAVSEQDFEGAVAALARDADAVSPHPAGAA